MTKSFARLETNLRKAGYILLAEILGTASLGILLPHFGLDRSLAILFAWICNLPAIWFLAQAAKRQDRNPWISGIISIPPLLALLNFLSL